MRLALHKVASSCAISVSDYYDGAVGYCREYGDGAKGDGWPGNATRPCAPTARQAKRAGPD